MGFFSGKKVEQLPVAAAPSPDDILYIKDATTGESQQTTLGEVSEAPSVPVVVTGASDTLAAGDLGKINRYTEAGLVTVTIPTDVSADLVDGFWCTLVAEGAAGLTLSTAGITVTGAANTTIAQGEAMVVIKTATANTWLVLGGTS